MLLLSVTRAHATARLVPLAAVVAALGCGTSATSTGGDAGTQTSSAATGSGSASTTKGTSTGSGAGTSSGGLGSSTESTGTSSGTSTVGSSSSSGSSSAVDSGTTTFAQGTICNATGSPLTPPATLKHVIVFMFENENFGNVNGNAAAPYMSSLASKCGYASNYADNCFAENLESLPHYLALTSGSNCNSGLDETGTGCITVDEDATVARLTTQSIFGQVSSWKSYQEDMPTSCDLSASGNYATKHNPAAYYSALTTCGADDISIAGVTCNANTTMTACGTPSNALTMDLANDTLPAFAFVTPNLNNDMHNGTVTEGDNWFYTYLPLVLQAPAYLRGEVVVLVLWDEQSTADFGGSTPNIFISPYVTAGTVAATAFNHFAVLRAIETSLGISTYLGCASGTRPGGGSCPTGSTADVRSALNF